MDSSEETRSRALSRRRLLRWLGFSAIGAGIVLSAPGLASAAFQVRKEGKSAAAPSTSIATSTGSVDASPSMVKAMYFQMPQAVGTKEEYFVLKNPAYLGDLLGKVVEAHPLLSTMLPGMMTLVDGVPASPSTALRDGDEVDFIPAVAGG